MSTITVTGILTNPSGAVLSGYNILFEAIRTSDTVINNTSVMTTSASNGAYSLVLGFGTYTLKIKSVREARYSTVASNILIYSTEFNNNSIQQIILAQDGLDDINIELIDQFLQIKADVLLNAQNASTSETNAAASAASALTSKNAAAASATSASSSATTATTKASEAASSATSASSSATTATTKATEAAASAASALASKNAATTSATNAATSAAGASTSASNAATSATLAGNYAAVLASVIVVPYTPTVNASLDLDFAKQKYKWYAGSAGITESNSMTPLITFSRSSTATYFDAMGVMQQASENTPRIDYDPLTGECKGLLVEEQRTNLLPYSGKFDTAWGAAGVVVSANTGISPAGDLVGAAVTVSTASQSNIYTPVTMVAGVVYTTSIYVKAGNTNVVTIRLWRGPTLLANVDITLGTSAEAVHVGNGWYRCTIISTASDGTNGAVLVYPGGRTTQSVGDYVYFWGAQLEAGSFPTSYIPTPATFTGRASTKTYFDSNGVMQTAASGVAATDYGYVDGRWVSKGLSLEGQATNVALYSSGTTLTGFNADTTTSTVPSTISGIALTQFLSSGGMARRIGFFGTALAKGDVVASLYLKKQNGSVVLGFSPWEGSISGATTINLDLTTGAGVLAKGLHTTAVHAVQDCGGLWRLSVALTYGAGNYTLGTFLFTTATTTDVTLGGLQAESGPVATSYIPTTTAQVTRAADTSTSAQVTRTADNAVISGANFSQWYKQYEGTVLLESVNPTTHMVDSSSVDRGSAVISDSTDTNRIRVGGDAGITVSIRKGGTDQSLQTVGSVSVGKHKTALSFVANNINAAIDAVSATQDVSAAIPYLTQLNIGEGAIAGGVWNGHIRSLKYYPKALLSIELQAMTA